LCTKNTIDSHYIKQRWLTGTLSRTNELYKLDNRAPPVDCAGFTDYSIFQNLENHSTFEIESECDCGTFYHRDYQLGIHNIHQMELLGDPKRLSLADLPVCKKCNDFRKLITLKSYPNNWFLSFKYLGRPPFNPLLTDIPRIVEVGGILYKLEYVGFILHQPNMNHAVSMHLIRHSWYEFDSGLSPKFRRWKKNRYDIANASLDRVVYFRAL
jgi:hypothetical protein